MHVSNAPHHSCAGMVVCWDGERDHKRRGSEDLRASAEVIEAVLENLCIEQEEMIVRQSETIRRLLYEIAQYRALDDEESRALSRAEEEVWQRKEFAQS